MLPVRANASVKSAIEWPDIEREQQNELKRKLVMSIYLKFIEAGKIAFKNDLSPGELAIFSVVYLNEDKGTETHAKLIPDYLGFSPATISRKLNGMVDRGYLKRTLRQGVYYYTIDENSLENCCAAERETQVICDLFDDLISAVSVANESQR